MICQRLRLLLSVDGSYHSCYTGKTQYTETTWHKNDPGWVLSEYTPPLAAFLNYISQLLVFWELTEIKSHTDHVTVPPCYPKVQCGHGGCTYTYFLRADTPGWHRQHWWSTVQSSAEGAKWEPSWTHCPSWMSASWPTLAVRNRKGRNPTKPFDQKSQSIFFFLNSADVTKGKEGAAK